MTKELFDGIGFAIVAGVIALCMANPMKASFEILPAPAEPRILKTDVTRDVTGNMADFLRAIEKPHCFWGAFG